MEIGITKMRNRVQKGPRARSFSPPSSLQSFPGDDIKELESARARTEPEKSEGAGSNWPGFNFEKENEKRDLPGANCRAAAAETYGFSRALNMQMRRVRAQARFD